MYKVGLTSIQAHGVVKNPKTGVFTAYLNASCLDTNGDPSTNCGVFSLYHRYNHSEACKETMGHGGMQDVITNVCFGLIILAVCDFW